MCLWGLTTGLYFSLYYSSFSTSAPSLIFPARIYLSNSPVNEKYSYLSYPRLKNIREQGKNTGKKSTLVICEYGTLDLINDVSFFSFFLTNVCAPTYRPEVPRLSRGKGGTETSSTIVLIVSSISTRCVFPYTFERKQWFRRSRGYPPASYRASAFTYILCVYSVQADSRGWDSWVGRRLISTAQEFRETSDSRASTSECSHTRPEIALAAWTC